MQRTTVLYAVAAATLVGAFLLSVQEAPAPAPVDLPPEPVPQNPGDVPLTHLSYGDGVLSIDARLDRGLYLVASDEAMYMDVALTGHDAAARSAISMVLVVDRSGSMAGEKIDDARLAAEGLIRRLKSGDQLAIVSYGTDVSVDLPLSRIDGNHRRIALSVVKNLEEGGGTNIDGALAATNQLLARAAAKNTLHNPRVILISDGRPTEGARSRATLTKHSTRLLESGAAVSTIGVGLDYNENLMEALADAGAGRYHYLKQSHQLTKILGDELQHATKTVAQRVQISLPAAFESFRVTEAAGLPIAQHGHTVQFDVGSLAAGETRHVLLKLERRPTPGGDTVAFSAPAISYTDAQGKTQTLRHLADTFRVVRTDDTQALAQSRRAEVGARVVTLEASLTVRDSMDDYKNGDVKKAIRRIQAQADALSSFAAANQDKDVAEQATSLRNVVEEVQAKAPASSSGQNLIKEQKARAYWLRR